MNKITNNSVPKHAKSTLLEKTCDLIRNFPEYLDVVVSVARKTDGRHWADLFSAAGRSTEYVFQAFILFFQFQLCLLFGGNSSLYNMESSRPDRKQFSTMLT